MRSKTHLFVVLVILLSMPFYAMSQELELNYGDIVTGEITDTEYEIEYSFTGNEGDVIVIEMKAVNSLGGLTSPELILLGVNGRVYADTSRAFNFSSTTLAAQLPDDGQYTIIATRRNGRAGDSVGAFTLELLLPEALEPDSPFEGMASSEGRTQYYLVETDQTFSVLYQRISGNLFPVIEVNALDAQSGGLESVAAVSGNQLTLALLGEFLSRSPYIVTVGEAPLDFNFREVTVNFTLTLRVIE